MVSVKLRINERATRRARLQRPINIDFVESQKPTTVTKAAEKLVLSVRENVKFLNRHLQPFDKYLDLPSLQPNLLYLAYTIGIKKAAPFKAIDLRNWLHTAGIETRDQFTFWFDNSSAKPANLHNNRLSPGQITYRNTSNFCIGCHQQLGIVDLEHIVDTLKLFFAQIEDRISHASNDETGQYICRQGFKIDQWGQKQIDHMRQRTEG